LKALARTMRVIPEWELDKYVGGAPVISFFNNVGELTGFLSNHVMSPDYVEIVFYFFTDGTFAAYYNDETHTASWGEMPYNTNGNDSNDKRIFYQWKEVYAVGHTHNIPGHSYPSDFTDTGGGGDVNEKVPGVDHYIFNCGMFYGY